MSFLYSFWNSRLYLKNLAEFHQTDLFFRHDFFNKIGLCGLYAEDIVLQRSCIDYSSSALFILTQYGRRVDLY